jgi:hypothetical protein
MATELAVGGFGNHTISVDHDPGSLETVGEVGRRLKQASLVAGPWESQLLLQ